MVYFIFVSIVLLVGGSVWWSCRNNNDADVRKVGSSAALVAPALAVLFSVWESVYQIPAGNVGIVYTFGAITGQRGDGLQWVAPWQDVKKASVQIKGHAFPKLASFSKETQEVFVDATINVQVSPKNIQELYREVGEDWFNILVRPRVLQAFKDETVKYTSVDIAPNREAIRKAVRERLKLELSSHSVSVQDLLLDNIAFSKEFQQSIENKQKSSQDALAEFEKVAGERNKADQKIEEARGKGQSILVEAQKQAEANLVLAKSITPELVQYLFASKLAPNVSVMMVPAGQQFIMGSDMLKQPTTR